MDVLRKMLLDTVAVNYYRHFSVLADGNYSSIAIKLAAPSYYYYNTGPATAKSITDDIASNAVTGTDAASSKARFKEDFV